MNKEFGMRKFKLIIILIPMAFLAAACNKQPQSTQTPQVVYKTGIITIASHAVNIQIADTDALRQLGLSNRDSLGENDGMLFIFSSPDKYSFWMKQMNFPLDFIWISQGKVTQITPNAPAEPNTPDQDLEVYLPDNPVDSVLEVNAGWAAKNSIKVGDSVAGSA